MFLRCFVLLASVASAQTPAVKFWQDTMPLPTYREEKPPPIPPFDQLALNGVANYFVYPYTLREYLTKDRYDAAWRVVHLENEYLHCRILPDLGGHVYGCVDKLSGAELFYANSSLKKTTSAPRGAWVAGGIETSFPIAHSRVSVSPVEFAAAAGPDGGATVWVGAVDRVSNMEWTVAYTLRPGVAVLEEKVTLHNRGPARQPFQFWTNAAVRVPDRGLKLTYPMWVTAPHGSGVLDRWPVNLAGVDLTDTANYANTEGLFAYGSREPFFATYNPESKIGVTHWAEVKDVPGKKLWVWGKSQDSYRDNFSDDHSGYMEMQAGLMRTQEMMEFLEPQQTRSFTERWIASRDTGGVTRGAPDAVLYMARRKQGEAEALLVDVSATRLIPRAAWKIMDGDRVLREETVDLSPAKTLHVETPATVAKLRFELRDGAGKLLLSHTEGVYDAVVPSEVQIGIPLVSTVPKPTTIDGNALRNGENDELIRMLDRAATGYEKALAAVPDSALVRKAAGRLGTALGRFEEAETRLESAHAFRPDDVEVSYYLGVVKAALGDDASATTLWKLAQDDPLFGAAARFELACAAARSGDWKAAAELLAGLAAKGNPRAAGMEVALLRRLGRRDDADAALRRGLAENATNTLARYEKTLAGTDDPALWELLGGDAERILDAADDYFALGLYEDAANLLGRSYPAVPELQRDLGAPSAADNPLIAYHRGYARLRTGQSPAADFAAGSKESTAYVYPSRVSTGAALEAAVKQNPQDATAHYLLGCLLMNRRMTNAALKEWDAAKPGGARLPGYYETVARVLTTVERNPKAAQQATQEAIAANPSDVELKKSLEAALRAPTDAGIPALVFSTPEEALDYALGALGAGRTGEALGIFSPKYFPDDKQPSVMRQAYVEVRLQRLLGAASAGKCNDIGAAIEAVGGEDRALPFTFASFNSIIKQPRIQFYLGLAEAACGAKSAASKRWARVAKSSAPAGSADYAFPFLAASVLGQPNAAPNALAAIDKMSEDAGGDNALRLYAEGMLLKAAGRNDEAFKKFTEGMKAGTRFTAYLNARASAEPAFIR